MEDQYYSSLIETEFDKLMQRYHLISETLERNPTLQEEYGDRTRRLGELLEDQKKILDLGE